MKPYKEMTREELLKERAALEAKFQEVKARGLKLDMSRGKPSKEQLDLANGMMEKLWYFGWYSGSEKAAGRYV